MNNIILVDDDKEFIKSFTNEAFAKGITISPKNSLDGLKQLLPALAHKYAAVVLDIKCLLQDDQEKEDAAFITAALKYLDSNIPGFPRFILTGDETEFDTLKKYYADEKMFVKKPDDQTKLLEELTYCVQNAVPLRLKRENPSVFAVFDQNLIPATKEQTLLTILKNYNELNNLKFRGIVGDIREIHEEVYKSINRRNKSVVPDKFINGNGSPTFTGDFYNHMQGNPDRRNSYAPSTTVYQDSTVSSQTRFIHSTCSEFFTWHFQNRIRNKSLYN